MKRPVPDISVLIASRGRLLELVDTIYLLRKNYSRKNGLEVLVRLDEDEPDDLCRATMEPGHATGEDWPGMANRTFVGPSSGWRNVHLLYNELASKARGRWLLPLSDDARLETPGWDRKLRSIQEKTCMVKFEDGWRPGPNFPTFPAITRTVYEGIGHLALSPHIGLWLDEVVRQRAGIPFKYFPEVKIRHVKPRPDVTDQQKEDINASYADFYSLEGEQQRNDDARRLLEYRSKQPGAKPKSEMLERKLDAISRHWFMFSLNR